MRWGKEFESSEAIRALGMGPRTGPFTVRRIRMCRIEAQRPEDPMQK
jgi:hypothetical protein